MNTVVFTTFLFTLVFAPLAFGTVELWSLATMETLAVTATLLFCLVLVLHHRRPYRVPGLLPLLLLLLLMVVQLVPLPPALVKALSPASYALYQPVLDPGSSSWIPLTLNQKLTQQEFLRVACYAFFYLLTVQLLSDRRRLQRAVHLVVWLGAAIAFLAIIQHVGSPAKIYWLRPAPPHSAPFGPWINPNQFAGFMALLSPLALSLFLLYKPRVHLQESWRERLVGLFTMPGSHLHLLFGFAAAIMVLSVFVSLCRGGILVVTLATLLFIMLYNLKRPRQGRTALLVVVGCLLVAISWFGWDAVVAEFSHGLDQSGRLQDARFELWANSLAIWRDFLFLGSGFGTFVDIYPLYRTIPGVLIFDHAHNDYLELLTDGGLVGLGLAGWFVLAVLHHGWQLIRVRRDHFAVLLGIGAITGILAVLLHSLTDFNMHNGAVGLYFFFLCGVMVAAVNSRLSQHGASSLLRRYPRGSVATLAVLSLVMTIVTVASQFMALAARPALQQVAAVYLSSQLSSEKLSRLAAAVERSSRLDPLEAEYSRILGEIRWFQRDRESTLLAYQQAARKQPLAGATLQRLALLSEDPDRSAELFAEGYRRAANKEELALNYVEYLLQTGAAEQAEAVLRERVAENPLLLRRWRPVLAHYGYDKKKIAGLLPRQVEAWVEYGAFLERLGEFAEAEFYRLGSLEFVGATAAPRPEWYQQAIDFYQRRQQPAQAIIILRQALNVLPDHAPFHLQLGEHYLREKLTYLAEKEFRRVLELDPLQRQARKRLRQMGLLDAYQ